MLGFGQPPFGAQYQQQGMPQGMPNAQPGMPQGMPNMAPQMPQIQRPPAMAPMMQMPAIQPQTHDNGLLQLLLGPAMNGQNGQALGLLKMLAQGMPQATQNLPAVAGAGMKPPASGFFGFGAIPGLGQQ